MSELIGLGAGPQGNAAGPQGTVGQGAAAGEVIKDSDEASFARDVIDASMQVPVIVDFWAPWCGPCKQLGPLLEKTVQAANGRVRLVKIDIDQNQALAQQLRIQSIPTVYAFFQGRPVDGFQGALPESEIKAFIARLSEAAGVPDAGGDPLAQALEQAEAAREAGDLTTASTLYGQILQHDPANETATAGLIRCHLDSGNTAEAEQLYAALPAELANSAAMASVKAAIELAAQTTETGDVAELMGKIAHNPADHQARFDLAMALQAKGQREAAADELLEIVRRDRAWNEEAARKQLLTFFEAWGPTDPMTQEIRRRLSTVLFS